MNAIGNSAVVQIKAQVSPRIFSNASSRSWNGGGRIQNAFRGIAIFRRTGVPRNVIPNWNFPDRYFYQKEIVVNFNHTQVMML